MRFFGIAFAVLTLGVVEAGTQPGYLAVVGPSPLRFQTPKKGRIAELPPLTISTPPKPVNQEEPDSTLLTGLPQDSTEPFENATDLPPLDDPGLTWPGYYPVGPASPALITPQMLQRMFIKNAATNATVIVIDHPQFYPALPPGRSSSATYTSPSKR